MQITSRAQNVIINITISTLLTIPLVKDDFVKPLLTSLGWRESFIFFCFGVEVSNSKTEHGTSDPMVKNFLSSGKLVLQMVNRAK